MKKILYFCLLLFSSAACMDDLGTYDYTKLKEMSIDTMKNQTIEIYKQLEIEPGVTFSDKMASLDYCWYRYTGNDLDVDTLSLEKKLSYNVVFPVGKYTIYLKVTDKNTGLSTKASFILSVVGKFDQGLMVLGEVDGVPDLVFLNSAGELVEVYGKENGHLLGSHPVMVVDASTTVSKLKNMLVLCADAQGGVTLKNADFSVGSSFADMFYVAPAVVKPQAYYKGFYYSFTTADFIINNGKLHGRYLTYAEEFGMGVSLNPAYPGDYELSPYAIVNGCNNLFYDNKHGRFLKVDGDWMSLPKTFSSIVSGSPEFDPSALGLTCVYMAEGADKRGYGIFKDAGGQLVKLVFSLNGDLGSSSSMTLVSREKVSVDAVDIDKSNSYAMSVAKPFMFYAKGSKVYLYGLDNNTSFPIYDTDTVKINGSAVQTTVDKIYMEYVANWDGFGSASSESNTVLYVASSENGKSGKKGSIHVLKLANNGTLESRVALRENVCGTTVSMGYKR